MKKVVAFFSGKKTYVAAALMIALGIVQGQLELVLEGVTLAALRAGVAKTGK